MGMPGLSTLLHGLFSTPKGRDHLVTYAAEGTVLVGTVIAYKLAVDELGSAGFEIYAVVRRTVSFVIPLLMFGLAVALIRFGAMASTDEERWRFTWNAGLLVLLVGVLVLLVTRIFAPLLGFIVFGDHAHDDLVPDMGLMLPGLMMHSVVYGYWRGAQRMDRPTGREQHPAGLALGRGLSLRPFRQVQLRQAGAITAEAAGLGHV